MAEDDIKKGDLIFSPGDRVVGVVIIAYSDKDKLVWAFWPDHGLCRDFAKWLKKLA